MYFPDFIFITQFLLRLKLEVFEESENIKKMALVNENIELHKNVKVKLFLANVLQHKEEIEEVCNFDITVSFLNL